jgi:DNA-directed RNA polymerase subunit RPC12/RpoP
LVFGFGKKYKCDTCGAKFSTESELMEHQKTHTMSAQSIPQVQQFKCKTCGMMFDSQPDLMQHTRIAHRM